MRTRISLALALLTCLAAPAWATDYHVSTSGDDTNPGSAADPWRSIARVNALALLPGDRVLFHGGQTFDGSLYLDSADAGRPDAPVVISSYGSGRATIAAGQLTGIFVYNAAGISITELNVVGDATGTSSGIVFYMDVAGKLPWVRIDSVEVSGFGRDGIEVGSWNGTSGFSDVRITAASAHHNARTGILTYAEQASAHDSVYVGYSRAFENLGIPTATTNTGSGIVLGGVNGGTIEWSTAYANGRLSQTTGGPVGIWTYDSSRVLIQHNESFANRTSSGDGGGFDLDQNVTDSIVQFNYSHDNDGAGYLLAHSHDNDAHHGNVIRNNVSINDGRRNSYGGIEIWGRVTAAEISNNTVLMAPSTDGSPSALRAWNVGAATSIAESVLLRDNIFSVSGGLTDISISPSQQGGLHFVPPGQTGPPGAVAPADIVLRAAEAATIAGAWRLMSDESASAGTRLWHPDAGAAKIVSPLAIPEDYFELTFTAQAGRGYRLWMRAAAESDRWSNDSVFAQFSSSLDASGTALWRIGTTSALEVNLEECSGCGVAGWGWQDNGWGAGVLGPLVYFATDGPQTVRIQTREDGVSIDQIVLSAVAFVTRAPGSSRQDMMPLPATATFAGAAPASASPPTPALPPRAAPLPTAPIFTAPILTSPTLTSPLPMSPLATSAPITSPPPGPAPSPVADEIVVYASDIPLRDVHGDWALTHEPTAAGGGALRNHDRGLPKIVTAAADPASYVDVTFTADAGADYQLWLRMRAEGDSYMNDSLYVQFSGVVDADGTPLHRIGTTEAAVIVLQDTWGATLAGWGWNDTGWAGRGMPIRFGTSGPQTLRIQQREDGIMIDQIVISKRKYLEVAPGSLTGDATIVAK